MSDITLHADYAAGLTAFNHSGLTLYIHDDGSVYWTQSAGAKMLNMEQGHLSNYLSRNAKTHITFAPVLHAQLESGSGLRTHNIYSVATLVALAKIYNPELLERFSLAGAQVYLYRLAGYKLKAQASQSVQTESELFRLSGQAMIELADIKDKLTNAPGIAAKLQAMPVSGYKAIAGKVEMYRIQDLLAMLGVSVDPKMYPAISRALNSALVSDGTIFRAMLDGRMVYPMAALATLKTLVS